MDEEEMSRRDKEAGETFIIAWYRPPMDHENRFFTCGESPLDNRLFTAQRPLSRDPTDRRRSV